MSYMPPEWKQWVVKCLLTGTPPTTIATTLSESGFAPDTIQQVLGSNLPATYCFSPSSDFYNAMANNALTRDNKAVSLADKHDIQLYSYENFLSYEECEEIVRLSKNKLVPSKLAGAASTDNIRTSSTCELAFLGNPLVQQINDRIVSALELGIGENEVIQAQHYNVGEYYKPHYDFFPPGSPQYKTHCSRRGQRTWTCMIYLNEDCEGGYTRFTKLDIGVKPQKGRALFWNNLKANGEPNLNTIHFAEPVISGNKTVITKWFRTKNE